MDQYFYLHYGSVMYVEAMHMHIMNNISGAGEGSWIEGEYLAKCITLEFTLYFGGGSMSKNVLLWWTVKSFISFSLEIISTLFALLWYESNIQ